MFRAQVGQLKDRLLVADLEHTWHSMLDVSMMDVEQMIEREQG